MVDNMQYTVLTGDIIGSSNLSPDQILTTNQALHDATEKFAWIHKDVLISNISIFRGDSWQLLLNHSGYALHMAILITCSLKAKKLPNTRISIATGSIDHIDKNNITRSTGEAFSSSGKNLDNIAAIKVEKNKPYWSIVTREPYRQLCFQLLGNLANAWTSKEAEIILQIMKNYRHQDVADKLNISRQVVSSRLARANWHLFEKSLSTELKQFKNHSNALNTASTKSND